MVCGNPTHDGASTRLNCLRQVAGKGPKRGVCGWYRLKLITMQLPNTGPTQPTANSPIRCTYTNPVLRIQGIHHTYRMQGGTQRTHTQLVYQTKPILDLPGL
jgi:hypothetical protein